MTPTITTPPSGPPASRPSPPRSLAIGIIAGVVALGVGVWLVFAKLPGWLAGPDAVEIARTKATGGGPAGEARKINAMIFFVTADGSELQAVTQDVLYGATPAEQARHIIELQLQPAAAGRVSAIPPGTTVRAVYVGAKGEAYVDLSPEVRTAHPGGSLNEALSVFTIVNALTANLPGITAVQILIDGKEVDSLAGHIDLRHPIGRSDSWVRKGQ